MKPITLDQLHAWSLSARLRVLAITAGFVIAVVCDVLLRPFRRGEIKHKSED